MNDRIIQLICDLYHIGEPVKIFEPLIGGFLHSVWRLQTTTGCYAVKRFNPKLLNADGYIARLDKAESVAEFFLQNGLIVICAIPASGVQVNGVAVVSLLSLDANTYENSTDWCVMVFPWVEGKKLSYTEITTNHGKIVGQNLAKIHNLNLVQSGFRAPVWLGFSHNHWKKLLGNINHGLSKLTLEELSAISTRAENAAEVANNNLVLSHRDLDVKNVLWQGDKPIILDWEYTGLINPNTELLATAFNWSGIITGNPNMEIFHAVIEAYSVAANRQVCLDNAVISNYIGYCLDWLEYCLRTKNTQEITNTTTALFWVLTNSFSSQSLNL